MIQAEVLIARHGNTFAPGETPRRVGARTDLPLVETERATAIGEYLKAEFKPDVIYCSPLLRTKQTAQYALEAAGFDIEIIYDDRFIELDYGPDENKIEDEVIARIGQEAMDLWNSKGIVPDGWSVDVKALKLAWYYFFKELETKHKGQKVLVVTSNGIARFAPAALPHLAHKIPSLKMKTGNLSHFQKRTTDQWQCTFWDKKPLELLS